MIKKRRGEKLGERFPADYQNAASDIQTESRLASGVIRVDPAGWSCCADWAGIVYPRRKAGSFQGCVLLAEYLDTIEINTSFYQPLHQTLRIVAWLRGSKSAISIYGEIVAAIHALKQAQISKTSAPYRSQQVRLATQCGKAGRRAASVPILVSSHEGQFELSKKTSEAFRRLSAGRRSPPCELERQCAFYEFLHARGVGFCSIRSTGDWPLTAAKTFRANDRKHIGYHCGLHGRRYDTWFSDDPETPAFETI